MGQTNKKGGGHRERAGYVHVYPPAPTCLATVLEVSLPVAGAPVGWLPLFAALSLGVVMVPVPSVASPHRLHLSSFFPSTLPTALQTVSSLNCSQLIPSVCKCWDLD